MKKKGLVYRFTMISGVAFIFLNMGGEMMYSVFMKQFRNIQLKQKKKTEDKIESMIEDEKEEEEEKSIVPDLTNLNPLVQRDAYRKDRLDRISKLRSNDKEMAINAPTRE